MSIHMAYTWFWSNIVHPFVLLFYYNRNSNSFDSNTLGSLLSIMVYSLLFSLPALFLSQLAGYLILKMHSSVHLQFLVWIIVAPLIALLNFALIFLLGGEDGITGFEPQFAIPAMIAVLIVVLLRYQSFFRACVMVNDEK